MVAVVHIAVIHACVVHDGECWGLADDVGEEDEGGRDVAISCFNVERAVRSTCTEDLSFVGFATDGKELVLKGLDKERRMMVWGAKEDRGRSLSTC